MNESSKSNSALQLDQSRLIDILALRVTSGKLKQVDLSEATGVHQSQISRILSGQSRRTSKNFLKLCKYAESIQVGPHKQLAINEEVLMAVTNLLGMSNAEDKALAQLVVSLSNWRKAWEGGR